MPRYDIVPATLDHAAELAGTMRAADVAELAELGKEPLPALKASLLASRDAFTGFVDGQVVCMFGIGGPTLFSREGVPWLLAAPAMVQHARVFLRLSRGYVRSIRHRYALLHNVVSARNIEAIRWLGWLGFTVHEQIIQHRGASLRYFDMRQDHV